MGVLSKSFYGSYTPEKFNLSVGLLIGTGPYRLASPTDWAPTPGKIELVRNERYWGLPPSFDRLVYYQVESDATETVMYENGELDYVGMRPQPYKLELAKPDVMARSQRFEYLSPIAGYHYIAWNELKNGKATVFADKRVRQAMTMLTNRQGICQDILLGYAQPARGPFNPLSKQDDKSLVDWTYDPAKAKALLQEAGFADRDGSGVLSLADGTRLSFKLSYPSKSETTERMMQYIRDNYTQAGVDAQLDPVDWTIIENRLKTRDFDAISLGWTAGLEDDIYQMFDSSQIAGEADDFMSYGNPALDTLIRAARTTLDLDERLDLWHQCQRIIHDDQPYTFLTVSKSLSLFDNRIKNIHQAKTGLNYVQDWGPPIPWYVPAALQKYKD
jgi:peptide/nickel transport system substrate-binding protein